MKKPFEMFAEVFVEGGSIGLEFFRQGFGSESAAAAVGYGNNPKYFTKVFKKYTGYTPTEYKQLYGRRV